MNYSDGKDSIMKMLKLWYLQAQNRNIVEVVKIV